MFIWADLFWNWAKIKGKLVTFSVNLGCNFCLTASSSVSSVHLFPLFIRRIQVQFYFFFLHWYFQSSILTLFSKCLRLVGIYCCGSSVSRHYISSEEGTWDPQPYTPWEIVLKISPIIPNGLIWRHVQVQYYPEVLV